MSNIDSTDDSTHFPMERVLPLSEVYQIADELSAVEIMAGRLRRHAVACPHDDQPDTLEQPELLAYAIGIQRVIEGLQQRFFALFDETSPARIALADNESH